MARVIRNGAETSGLHPAEVWDARLEAERVVRRGRARAREVVEAALAEAEAIRAAAHEEGWCRGRAEAAAELLLAATERRAVLEATRADIARLAIASARRILDAELRLAPERVEDLVRAAIASAPPARSLRLCVHPEDAERARTAVEGAAPDSAVEIVPRLGLDRGDCILETDGGSVDARVEVQLALLEARLLGTD